MPAAVSFIGDAWKFFQKHPVLNQVVGLLIFVPSILLTFALASVNYHLQTTVPPQTPLLDVLLNLPPNVLVHLVIAFFLLIWITWGLSAILIVSKRLVKSQAGRAKTSFKSVCKDAQFLVIPMILTWVLYIAIGLLWAVPGLLAKLILETMAKAPVPGLLTLILILPSFIYWIRASMFPVAIASEKKEYWAALDQSQRIVKKHGWSSFFQLISIFVWTVILPFLLIGTLELYMLGIDGRLVLIVTAIDSITVSLISTTVLLTLSAYYSYLKKHSSATA